MVKDGEVTELLSFKKVKDIKKMELHFYSLWIERKNIKLKVQIKMQFMIIMVI